MKQMKLFAAAIAVGMSLLFSSCGSGDKKTDVVAKDTTVATTDTTQKAPPPPAPPSKPNDLLVIRHKVANYAKWKEAYESSDSARVAAGLHNYLLMRDVNDSNMVTVSVVMDDSAKAKAFGASPDLKAAMKKAGVISAPTIQMLDVKWLDTSAVVGPTRLRVSFKVKDYDTWKKGYDSHKQARVDAGLTDRMTATDMSNPNVITVVFAVSDMAKAKAFITSKDLKDKMKDSGVEGPPTVIFYNIVQKYYFIK